MRKSWRQAAAALAVCAVGALACAPGALASTERSYAFSFGSYGPQNGQLSGPYGVAVSPTSGDVYVADTSNSRVQIFNPTGGWLGQTFGIGVGCTTLQAPEGLAVNGSTGDVYVVDFATDEVDHLSPNGSCLGSFGGSGSGNGQFENPAYDAVDPSTGDVYVTDSSNRRVEQFDANGNFIRAFGSTDFGGNQPHGIAFDPASGGLLFVSDTGGNVDEFDATGGFLRAFTNQQLTYPEGVAIDPASGNVYVGNGAGRDVLEFTPTGSFVTSFAAQASSSAPAGVAFSPVTDDMYFTDIPNEQVEVFAPPPTCQGSSASVPHDASQQVTLSCSDPSFQPQTFAVASVPAHGTLGAVDQVSPTSATVIYTPSSGYSGTDSFTFAASGVGTSAPATVSLTVAAGAASTVGSPGTGTSGTGTITSPATAPVLSGLRVNPGTFSIAGRRVRGRCVAVTGGNRARPRCTRQVRLLVSYTDSEAGTVTFGLERVVAGRQVHGRCVAATRANRTHAACTRVVRVPGSISRQAVAGVNTFNVVGRLDGVALIPGNYDLIVTPTSGGGTGRPVTVGFVITGG